MITARKVIPVGLISLPLIPSSFVTQARDSEVSLNRTALARPSRSDRERRPSRSTFRSVRAALGHEIRWPNLQESASNVAADELVVFREGFGLVAKEEFHSKKTFTKF